MKKLLFILLCLPLFLFSQEERQYESKMSFTQFKKELHEAAEQGIGYTLENCVIVNDRVDSIEFILKDLRFIENTEVIIKDCKFNKELQFRNSIFHDIRFIDVETSSLILTLCQVSDDLIFSNTSQYFRSPTILVENSTIHFLCVSDHGHLKDSQSNRNIFDGTYCKIEGNKIDYASISAFEKDVYFRENTTKAFYLGNAFLDTKQKMGKVIITSNTFLASIGCIANLLISNNNTWDLVNSTGLIVSFLELDYLKIDNNKFENIKNELDHPLQEFLLNDNKDISQFDFFISSKIPNYERSKNIVLLGGTELILENKRYDESWQFNEKIDFLEEYKNKNTVKIIYNSLPSTIEIRNSQIKSLRIAESPGIKHNSGGKEITTNNVDHLVLSNNDILESMEIRNNKINSTVFLEDNNLPSSRIDIDANFVELLGFLYHNESYDGTESFKEIEEIYDNSEFKGLSAKLMEAHLKILTILESKGSNLRNDVFRKINQLKKAKAEYDYQYSKPDLEKWFVWKGFQFLEWYSDYGMNPFKALSYCFWTMIWFAIFYFIFYNDWDKIDRIFLIKRFNSVMDYFTTEKRIQDFYSSIHDKEMTTFTEFKDTLDKNKVYMPTMLSTLARPIYQISLLRYKILNFSYKRAEFMAGRKWVDLKKRDRYLIGTLTFFLTLTYIIYLIFIRALNSIILSINAFSTLGFGQIPVRGFTKYVAIIEGFIGWFLLSVFIVSLLSQMMNV